MSEWDPAYTDNDALCPFCRCLVDQHAVCDGSLITHEYEVGEEGESRTTRDPITGEARLDLWPEKTEYWNRSVFTEIEVTDDRDRLMASIFHSTCPLCQEFLRCRRTTIGGILEQNPTVKHITIVRLLRLSPPGLPKYCAAILHARYNKGDAYDPRRELVSMFKLITEKHPDFDLPSPIFEYLRSSCNAEAEKLRHVDVTVGNPGPFASNTGSDLSWKLAAKWVTTCVSNHQACNASTRSSIPPLPTRLIDVGPGDAIQPPRLHVVTDDTPQGRYATLSHCWFMSSHAPFKLLKDNIIGLTKEIPLAALPPVFRDALEATRRIGLRYIWIDSICIIQDSDEDWHRESARMNAIYANSYCNIAAADATELETQGCFFDRDPSAVRPVRLHVDWEQLSENYYTASTTYSFSNNVIPAPLYKRLGWAYQEQLLSPRIIHCCSKQLYWECHELRASESFPLGLPHALDHKDGTTVCDPDTRDWWYRNTLLPDRRKKDSVFELPAEEDREKERSLEALATWNRALKEYSRLPLEESENLTRDRLVAISGVAESLSKQIGGYSQYIAGLWGGGGGDAYRYFAEQLLWRRVVHYDKSLSNDHPIELVGGAPSWSWASISGAVEYINYHYRKDEFDVVIDILEAKAKLVDESCPFGAVKGGSLRIRGPLLDSDMIEVGGDPIDKDLLSGNLVWQSGDNIYLDSGPVGDYQLDVIEERNIPDARGLWFWLPIIYSQCNGSAMGLILERVDDGGGEEEDVFKRVGMFQIPEEFCAYDNEDSLPFFQELFIQANGRDDDGPFPEWGPRRIITIV